MENSKPNTDAPEFTALEFRLGLISQETETRMRIAELAAQLLQVTTMTNSATMATYMSIYRELCNEILEPLMAAKEDDVVPKMQ